MVEEKKTMKTSAFQNCMCQIGFYEWFLHISVISQLLVDFSSSQILSYYFTLCFLGCSLTKLSPTTNFQYILDQELFSVSSKFLHFFRFIKCLKKVIEIKKKKFLVFFTDKENDDEIDEICFEICFTLELHMVKELVQKMMDKHEGLYL